MCLRLYRPVEFVILVALLIAPFSYAVSDYTFNSSIFLRTASGKKLPLAALSDFSLPSSSGHVEHNLFEVFHETWLRGTNVYEDLTGVSETHFLPPEEEPDVYIDGKLVTLASAVKVQTGPIWTTVIDAIDGKVLQIWSDQLNLNLVPVGADYPGIFVNTARAASDSAHLHHNDGIHPRKIKNRVRRSAVNLPVFSDAGEPFDVDKKSRDDNIFDRATVRQPGRKPCSSRYPRKIVEIAVAFDNKFCKRFDRDARKAISVLRALTLAASAPYELQTCLKLKIVHVDGYCNDENDPYINLRTIPDVEEVLTKFKIYWYQNKADVARDLAVYFTGWDDGSNSLGIAYLGFACSQFGYALVELANRHVYAHEVAHTLNARHTNAGIMNAYYSKLKTFRFSDISVKQIVDFVDNRTFISSCLQKEGFPTPTPKPPSRTCKNGFSKSSVLLCKTYRMARLSAIKGKVIVSIRIENNVVEIRMGTNFPQSKIWYVMSFLSLRKDLSVQNAGKMFGFEKDKGVRHVRQRWTMDDLHMPKGVRTCCGATYYLYAWVTTCNFYDCVDQYIIQPFKLPCGNHCSGKPGTFVVPMSANRKCPLCMRKSKDE